MHVHRNITFDETTDQGHQLSGCDLQGRWGPLAPHVKIFTCACVRLRQMNTKEGVAYRSIECYKGPRMVGKWHAQQHLNCAIRRRHRVACVPAPDAIRIRTLQKPATTASHDDMQTM